MSSCAWSPPASERPPRVRSSEFYQEYHGHRLEHLVAAHARLRQIAGCGEFIYLAGDSSLDNKHWFFAGHRAKADQMEAPLFTAPALNGYEMVFEEVRGADVYFMLRALSCLTPRVIAVDKKDSFHPQLMQRSTIIRGGPIPRANACTGAGSRGEWCSAGRLVLAEPRSRSAPRPVSSRFSA